MDEKTKRIRSLKVYKCSSLTAQKAVSVCERVSHVMSLDNQPASSAVI